MRFEYDDRCKDGSRYGSNESPLVEMAEQSNSSRSAISESSKFGDLCVWAYVCPREVELNDGDPLREMVTVVGRVDGILLLPCSESTISRSS